MLEDIVSLIGDGSSASMGGSSKDSSLTNAEVQSGKEKCMTSLGGSFENLCHNVEVSSFTQEGIQTTASGLTLPSCVQEGFNQSLRLRMEGKREDLHSKEKILRHFVCIYVSFFLSFILFLLLGNGGPSFYLRLVIWLWVSDLDFSVWSFISPFLFPFFCLKGNPMVSSELNETHLPIELCNFLKEACAFDQSFPLLPGKFLYLIKIKKNFKKHSSWLLGVSESSCTV